MNDLLQVLTDAMNDGARREVIAYAYRGNAGSPYRASRVRSSARDLRPVLRRVARRVFGTDAVVALQEVRGSVDRQGRNLYGPSGREVIADGRHFQVWQRGCLVGYVSGYEVQPTEENK